MQSEANGISLTFFVFHGCHVVERLRFVTLGFDVVILIFYMKRLLAPILD